MNAKKKIFCESGTSYREDESVCCDGDVIDEYEELKYHTVWLTEAEMRMLIEKAKRRKRARKIV